jgi:hypothetical protein
VALCQPKHLGAYPPAGEERDCGKRTMGVDDHHGAQVEMPAAEKFSLQVLHPPRRHASPRRARKRDSDEGEWSIELTRSASKKYGCWTSTPTSASRSTTENGSALPPKADLVFDCANSCYGPILLQKAVVNRPEP